MKVYCVIDSNSSNPTLFLRKEDAVKWAVDALRAHAFYYSFEESELQEAIEDFYRAESTYLGDFEIALYEREVIE